MKIPLPEKLKLVVENPFQDKDGSTCYWVHTDRRTYYKTVAEGCQMERRRGEVFLGGKNGWKQQMELIDFRRDGSHVLSDCATNMDIHHLMLAYALALEGDGRIPERQQINLNSKAV